MLPQTGLCDRTVGCLKLVVGRNAVYNWAFPGFQRRFLGRYVGLRMFWGAQTRARFHSTTYAYSADKWNVCQIWATTSECGNGWSGPLLEFLNSFPGCLVLS